MLGSISTMHQGKAVRLQRSDFSFRQNNHQRQRAEPMPFSSVCRITESLRLEKTSQAIKSNHDPNTTMPAKPCPQVPHLQVFEPLQGWGLHHCPGQPAPMPDNSFSKEIFANLQPEPPLTQLEAIASCPVAC